MKKDAAVKKVLAELNLSEPKEFTEEDEELWRYATDPEYRFLKDIQSLYQTNEEKPNAD